MKMIKLGDEFRIIVDICNAFGYNYRGYRKATLRHTKNELFWFPKAVKKNNPWINELLDNGQTIQEKYRVDMERVSHVNDYLEKTNVKTRITFIKLKNNYVYVGNFQLDKTRTNVHDGLIWKRTGVEIET